jgi:hypothetical protein
MQISGSGRLSKMVAGSRWPCRSRPRSGLLALAELVEERLQGLNVSPGAHHAIDPEAWPTTLVR